MWRREVGLLILLGGLAVGGGHARGEDESGRLVNFSVRTRLAANRPLMAGYVVTGGARTLLQRGIGPGLAPFMPAGSTLAEDPRLQVFAADGSPLAANDDWGGGAGMTGLFDTLGAFALLPASRDAALAEDVSGLRTAHLVNGADGIALVEVYDASPMAAPGRLVNLSARYAVTEGHGALIAGFSIEGTGPVNLLIRGIGPSMAQPPFLLAGTLPDPELTIFDGEGRPIARNDNWDITLAPVFAHVEAFSLAPGSRDAAIVLTLAPGVYTAHVTGRVATEGDALVEIYEIRGQAPVVPSYLGEPCSGWGAHVFRWWDNYAYQDFVADQLALLHRSTHRAATEALGAQTPGSSLNANALHLKRYLDLIASRNQQLLLTFAAQHTWTQAQVENQVARVVQFVVDSGRTAQVLSYEGVNEPDKNEPFTERGAGMQQLKAYQQWLWNSARSVDPACRVGVSPITGPSVGYNRSETGDDYLDDMLRDTADGPGVLRHATHLSIHGYDRCACEFRSDGVPNPGWTGRVWAKMQQHSPVGVKPVWNTEGGYNSNFFFNGATPARVRSVIDYRVFTALVHYQWFVGTARVGIQRGVQYALAKDPRAAAADKGNNIWFYPGEGAYNPPEVPELGDLPREPDGPREFIYHEMILPFTHAHAFQYATLEQKGDGTRVAGDFEKHQVDILGFTQLYPWHIVFDSRPPAVASGPVPFVEWESTVHELPGGEARMGGQGCLRMSARANHGRNKAWRLISNLPRGADYSISAWVKVQGAGRATLKACGTKAAPASDGPGDIAAVRITDTAGQYVQLVLPDFEIGHDPEVHNNWVVIELDHDGVGTVWWDDVTIRAIEKRSHLHGPTTYAPVQT